ncbi:MAG: DegV family protein [Bacilli bacterium]|nr:DegV family protein [Bacilli bacterium]
MKNFEIICDVTCDLNEELQERFDIKVMNGYIKGPDGNEVVSTCHWDNEEAAVAFYTDLKKNPKGYSSAPASPDEVAVYMNNVIEAGQNNILFLTISSGLSGTYNFVNAAKEIVLEKHPEANIKVVDSLRYSTAFGLIATKASALREEGKSLDEVFAWVEENKNCYHQMGSLDDLSFLAKKGRLNNFKAFMGTLVGVKPMGDFNQNGLTTVIGKAKGMSNAYEAILEYIERTIVNPSEQIIFVAQTNRKKFALEFIELLKNRINPKEVILTNVHRSTGINVGPGLMAAYYYGKPISENCVEEEKICKEILGK